LDRAVSFIRRLEVHDPKFPPPDGPIDFEAWKSDDPENTRVIIISIAGTADKETIAEALAHLGWYRKQQKKPSTRAWIIAKSFSPAAMYAARVCPNDLTLKSYEVEISTFHRIMWWNVSPFSESLQR
jgi:hypothetical protein